MLAAGSPTLLGAVLVLLLILVGVGDLLFGKAAPPPPPVKFPEPVKAAVFYRAGGRCEYCGVRVRMGRPGFFDTWREFNCDHIVPESKGGLGVLSNGASSCAHCNQVIKADRDWPEFVREFKRYHWCGPGRPKAMRGRG